MIDKRFFRFSPYHGSCGTFREWNELEVNATNGMKFEWEQDKEFKTDCKGNFDGLCCIAFTRKNNVY